MYPYVNGFSGYPYHQSFSSIPIICQYSRILHNILSLPPPSSPSSSSSTPSPYIHHIHIIFLEPISSTSQRTPFFYQATAMRPFAQCCWAPSWAIGVTAIRSSWPWTWWWIECCGPCNEVSGGGLPGAPNRKDLWDIRITWECKMGRYQSLWTYHMNITVYIYIDQLMQGFSSKHYENYNGRYVHIHVICRYSIQ